MGGRCTEHVTWCSRHAYIYGRELQLELKH
jgi:hypothetical protein